MKYTKQELINSIKAMQEIVDDKENAEPIRESIRPSLAEAKKLLADLEKTPAAPATGKKRSSKEIMSAAKKASQKGSGKMTSSQKNTLKKIVDKSKKLTAHYQGYSEPALKRDAARSAKKTGSRKSASGSTYREYRPNRSDISQKAPHLAKGGKIEEIWISVDGDTPQTYSEFKEYWENVTDIPKNQRLPKSVINEIGKLKVGEIYQDDMGDVSVLRVSGPDDSADNYLERGGEVNTDDIWLLPGGDDSFPPIPYSEFVENNDAGGIDEDELFTENDLAQVRKLKIGEYYTLPSNKNSVWRVPEPEEYATGEAIDNQITFDGYTTTTFTAQAKLAFEEAISQLESEKDKESTYYKVARTAMKVLIQNTNTLLKQNQDPEFVHAFLQSVGVQNYKTGLLLDTNWLNKELAVRKLAQGGRIKSAINRDRAFKSKQKHEQAYIRKKKPLNPKYKYGKGGSLQEGVIESVTDNKAIREAVIKAYKKGDIVEVVGYNSGGSMDHLIIRLKNNIIVGVHFETEGIEFSKNEYKKIEDWIEAGYNPDDENPSGGLGEEPNTSGYENRSWNGVNAKNVRIAITKGLKFGEIKKGSPVKRKSSDIMKKIKGGGDKATKYKKG